MVAQGHRGGDTVATPALTEAEAEIRPKRTEWKEMEREDVNHKQPEHNIHFYASKLVRQSLY